MEALLEQVLLEIFGGWPFMAKRYQHWIFLDNDQKGLMVQVPVMSRPLVQLEVKVLFSMHVLAARLRVCVCCTEKQCITLLQIG